MFKAFKLAGRLPFIEWAVGTLGISEGDVPESDFHAINFRVDVFVKKTGTQLAATRSFKKGYHISKSASQSEVFDLGLCAQIVAQEAQRWLCSTVEQLTEDIRTQHPGLLFPVVSFIEDTEEPEQLLGLIYTGQINSELADIRKSQIPAIGDFIHRNLLFQERKFNDLKQ